MKKLFSTNYTDTTIGLGLLLLRATAGILMAAHGYQKLTHFQEMEPQFMEFMGLSKSISLSLVIGAEFFCSLLLTLGLITRLALIPLIITMGVAVFDAHTGDIFGKGQTAFLFLAVYVVIMIAGPGKFSADKFIFK